MKSDHAVHSDPPDSNADPRDLTPEPEVSAVQPQGNQDKDRILTDYGKRTNNKLHNRVLLAILLLLLVLLGLYFTGVFNREDQGVVVAGDLFPGEGEAQEGIIPGLSEEEILARMQKVADESMFSFKINALPVFKDGNSAGSLGIENPKYNIYPMVVQIFLDDTQEKIYDSGGILPGYYIDNAKLTKVLKAGKYKATAYLNAYDPDTKVYKGKSAAALTITIEN